MEPLNGKNKYGIQTIAIHGGLEWKEIYPYPVNAPIFASSTFAFQNVDHGARIFQGEEPGGYTYGRLANPTVRDAELRLAHLEGAEDCLLLASGMAAVSTLIFTVLKKGDHLVADNTLYGGTMSLFTHELENHGIEVTLVDASDPENVRKALKNNTKLIYFETPTNPTLRLVPIQPIVEIAKECGILTAIDSTFMTPILMRPIEMGVDFVIHSATKYLNGQSDVIAGAICGSQELIAECRMTSVHHGGILGPFEAFLLSRGMKTLKIRMDAHERGGRIIAKYLADHPLIKKVYYPGLETHPQHELAKQQANGFGAMIGFELKGDLEIAKKFVDNLNLVTRAVSLGGVESLLTHPASTTHSIVDEEDRKKAGITDTYMRLSVGLEDPEDIIKDFEQAFDAIKEDLAPLVH
ncbi:MAG: aminotransferase class I/II-fold pyridoxal phosphate-dependent enzyme [Methanobacteriota archaeon]|nr:MAG: aminotransferase class I/II-fold pyridoxal phosphate-dependent enzyme [Euryarchaeota archaeon]